MARPTPKRLITLAVAFSCVAVVLAWFAYPYLPGTLDEGTDGRWRGTGTHTDVYPQPVSPAGTRPVARKTRYVAGAMRHQWWYHPDGRLLTEEDWSDGSGISWDFYEDGSLHYKMEASDGVAHGTWTHYNRDGSVMKVEEYRHGKLVAGSP